MTSGRASHAAPPRQAPPAGRDTPAPGSSGRAPAPDASSRGSTAGSSAARIDPSPIHAEPATLAPSSPGSTGRSSAAPRKCDDAPVEPGRDADPPPTPHPATSASAPAVTLSGRFRHAGAVLFDDLTLRLDAGVWTCLLGPSGVGKSTLLRLLAGLDPGGTFEGRIETGDEKPLTGRVGYMAQSDLLAPWLDVRGNVTLGARLRGERPDFARAERVIARVGLAPHAAKRPRELSGGMRQRVALARALMEDRALMLLDEPFSALDAKTRAEMQELAFETLAGRTVLLVTHEPAEAARLGARILLMDRAGLTDLPTPAAAPIRPADAPETLEAQAALLRRLRGGSA